MNVCYLSTQLHLTLHIRYYTAFNWIFFKSKINILFINIYFSSIFSTIRTLCIFCNYKYLRQISVYEDTMIIGTTTFVQV